MSAGQLFFRDAGKHPNGQRLMMVVGVIPIPDDIKIKPEHQHSVVISTDPVLDLHVVPGTAVDRSEISRGCGLGHLVTQPIWRFG